MTTMEYKEAYQGQFQIKTGTDGYGRLSGYAATFNNIDQVGDIILPGAFTKTLPDFMREGYLAISHDHAALPAGTIDVAREDFKGLWVESEIHNTQAAQDMRHVSQARLAKGKSMGLSIGYIVPKDGFEYRDDGVRLLKTIDLKEISVTSMPANREALISGVKQALSTLSGKEGRAISTDRRARLAAIRDALATLKDLQGELDDMLAETEPPSGGKSFSDREIERIFVEFYAQKYGIPLPGRQRMPVTDKEIERIYKDFYLRKH